MKYQATTPSTLSQKECWKLKQKSNVTSWYNTNEFNHVGQSLSLATQLFPSSSTTSTIPYYHEISNAIKRVSIWRKRSNHNNNGRLPNSIDVTASLAESLLQDAIQQQQRQQQESISYIESTNHTSMPLRLTYASTIIRGVNGIADTMSRNRSIQIATAAAASTNGNDNDNKKGSLSVAKLCSKVGLPSWIVDLRHDASHQELPSLTTLRLGAVTLLQCYMNIYWNVIMNNHNELKMKGLDYLMELESHFKNDDNDSDNNNKDSDDGAGDCNDNGNGDDEEGETEKKSEHSSKYTSDDENNNDDSSRKKDNNSRINRKKKEESNVTPISLFSAFLNMEGEQQKRKKAERKAEKLKIEMKKKKKKKLKTIKKMQTQQRQSILRKQEQCMKDFLKNVPIDIAYDLLLSYFVWGGIGIEEGGCGIDGKLCHKNNNGVLIPNAKSPSSSFPQSQMGIRSIREQYGHTLIVQVCKVWPGFIVCIFVNLVDLILVLECELDEINAQEKVSASADPTSTSTNGKIDQSNDYCKEIGRKLYFLFAWVQYLLSNEFYFHLDWIQDKDIDKLQSVPDEQQSKPKKKNIEWLKSQRNILESSAPLDILKIAQLPLNSLCDRCITYNTTNSNSNDTCSNKNSNSDDESSKNKRKTTCMEIISLFNDILQDERVENNGIAPIIQSNNSQNDYYADKKKRKILEVDSRGETLLPEEQVKKRKGVAVIVETQLGENKDGDSKREENEVGDSGGGDSVDDADNDAEKTSFIIKDDAAKIMSLEDMERMLSDDDIEDDNGNDSDNGDKEKSNSDEENDCLNIHSDATSLGSSANYSSETRIIKPWTLCTSWDACAIGTLPGHVS